jgi:hypothetical protein
MAILSALPTAAAEEQRANPPPTVRSLPWLGNDCTDPRLPTLSGPWAIGCKGESTPNRAQHIQSGQQLEFPALGQHWGHGEGVLVDHSNRLFWRIGEETREKLSPFSSKTHAPLTSDGVRLVISSQEKLEWMNLGNNQRFVVPKANPAPWYTAAISGDHIAWVQKENAQASENIWLYSIQEKRSWAAAKSDENERHVAIQGDEIAWLTDTAVHLFNIQSQAHAIFPGRVHSNENLSLSKGVVCWEALEKENIDVHCSDGLHLKRPGDQRHPSRWNEWLLVHEGNTALLVGPMSTMAEKETL